MSVKILVVDDDYSFGNYAKLLIESLGYEVILEFDARKALDLVLKEKPSVILIDASMPHLSGAQLISLLKANERTSRIPILLCSITHERKDIEGALHAGAMEFLPKPLNRDELDTRLKQALNMEI